MRSQKTVKRIKHKKICTNWKELYEAYNFFYEEEPQSKYKWIFRGENYGNNRSGNLSKALKSSLDKAFERFDVKDDKRSELEKKLVRSFQRKAHLYSGGKLADLLESLALLRHYGGAARMLDWVYSFFVGVYFAVARAKSGDNLALWALNNKWLRDKNKDFEDKEVGRIGKYKKITKEEEPAAKSSIGLKYLQDFPKLFIYAVNPYYLNERLSIQQGVLLVQGDIEKSWGANLKDMIKEEKNSKYDALLWKIDIKLDIKELKNVLKRLHHINISQATLFPDLGGFAQSLTNRIADPRSLGLENSDC